MHELALCQSVLDILRRQAADHHFDRVTLVRLEIGALSCVSPEALEFGFVVAARGTIADGARLELVRLPGSAWCLDCAEEVEVAERVDPCPRCGGYRLQITRGDEMRVKDLEVA